MKASDVSTWRTCTCTYATITPEQRGVAVRVYVTCPGARAACPGNESSSSNGIEQGSKMADTASPTLANLDGELSKIDTRPASVQVKHYDITAMNVEHVTVYLDRAEVRRSVLVNVKKGENEVLFKKLSQNIDKDSIRVECKGPASITEVTYHSKFIPADEAEENKKIRELKDKLNDLEKTKKALLAKKHRLEKQRSVLDGFADNMIKPTSPGENKESNSDNRLSLNMDTSLLDCMSGFFDLYDKQAQKLDESLQDLDQEIDTNEDAAAVTRKNIQELEISKDSLMIRSPLKTRNRPIEKPREVLVVLDTKEEARVELIVSYVVSKARWAPKYDMRVFTKDSAMKPPRPGSSHARRVTTNRWLNKSVALQIQYFGVIRQNTGENWQDATISLSTSLPSVGGTAPSLGTQVLSFKNRWTRRWMPDSPSVGIPQSITDSPLKMKKAARRGLGSFRRKDKPQIYSPDRSSLIIDDEGTIDMVEDSELFTTGGDSTEQGKDGLLSTTYDIPRKANIPSDNQPHKVQIAMIDFNPTFEHETAPKRSPHAFLRATVKNDSEYALLAGPVNVYLDNNFIAKFKSDLRTVAPSEEFTCSLGADPAVKVIYKPLHKYREQSGVISKTTQMTYRQVIEIKNLRPDPIKITVSDQLPLSTEEKIKVNLQEPSIKHPEKNDKNKPIRLNAHNNVEWTLNIEGGKTHEVTLKYSIEHPPGEEVEIKNEKIVLA
ncbi:PREDICTED: protein F37C4.5-like isoform X1 [Branchiostoma belcheri]|uniref:Protein F37C4.5-like isoform X1 n=2 Tax=Branchiostoma belcheri TaxID=7741 RepID=A0A6P4YP79_BRABE|nr:PREDICTED: protein F37C4.5-like isoform X1 [Branchiostoma belcheri]